MSDTEERPIGSTGSGQAGEAPQRRSRPRLVLTAAFTIVVVGAIAAAALYAPIPVTLEGSLRWLPRGLTVAALEKQGLLASPRGDILSVKGAVLRPREGASPVVRVGGVVATATTPVGIFAKVTSTRGPDVVEPTKTSTIETKPTVRYLGSGPIQSVEDPGTPGKIELVLGTLSGQEASRRVVSKGYPMTIRREPSYHGAKEVALTFDDGPWPKTTDAILAELKAANVKATFFMIGYQLSNRPEIGKRVLAAGMEIGDHSHSHKLLAKQSYKTITNEISWGAQAITRVLGVKPAWFRPPGGSVNPFVYSETKRLGMRLVLWDIDPKDWKKPGARVISKRILDAVRPGAIILMHDGGGDRTQTVAALKVALAGLKARGYKMVTLSQLHRLP
jgi:peptidoglycan-N-acetylglucosamine deacetylase